jgi:putative inorganic carbon (HCO3(-)) transporter
MVPARRAGVSLEWTYVITTIATFVFIPEVRRLVEWRGNFDPFNTFAVIPLLMLCPIAFFAYRRRARIRDGMFAAVAIIWLAGFAYAGFIAAAYGSILAALLTAVQFCLPLAVAAWLMTLDDPMEVAHARLARVLLICGAIAGAYGIFQYVVAPPWDTAWMQNLGLESFGQPVRFGIRVFSTLNGPGIFALFMSAVILFNLPYLRIRNWLNVCALFLITVSLILSLVRLAWLTVVVGIVIFALLSPKRIQALLSLASVAIVCGVAIVAFVAISPNASLSNTLIQRVSTLTDVQEDASAQDRRATTDEAVQNGLDHLEGGGLGLVSAGTALETADLKVFRGSPSGAIDNGFASRFLEMGVPGLAAFLLASCLAIFAVSRAYLRFSANRNNSGMLVAASCLAAQVTFFAQNIGGDNQHDFLGVIFFAALALPLMCSAREGVDLVERPTQQPWSGIRSKAAFRYRSSS